MVPGALGTQTGGSIIRPAGYCGVVGYKPSFGMVNRAGLKFSAESMDTIGTFARSVLDVSILAHVLSSHRSAPQTSKARSLRVRILKTEQWGSASGEAQDALMRAVGALKAAGHSCFDQELPAPFRRLHDAHLTMMNYEIARSAAWEFRSHESLLSNEFAQRVRAGMKIGYEEYCRAAHEAAACRLQVGQEFTKADVFLTLSTPGEAPVGLESTGPSTFNKVWTLLHLPCANLPFGSGSNGFPLGVQLIGAPGDDQQFLSDAAIVEAVLRSAAAISSGCKEQHDKT
jgi:Asp-tRNA(Asn)/Glu-tRNA(Gln) amidotransferase A subunit family amidase